MSIIQSYHQDGTYVAIAKNLTIMAHLKAWTKDLYHSENYFFMGKYYWYSKALGLGCRILQYSTTVVEAKMALFFLFLYRR